MKCLKGSVAEAKLVARSDTQLLLLYSIPGDLSGTICKFYYGWENTGASLSLGVNRDSNTYWLPDSERLVFKHSFFFFLICKKETQKSAL